MITVENTHLEIEQKQIYFEQPTQIIRINRNSLPRENSFVSVEEKRISEFARSFSRLKKVLRSRASNIL